MLDSWVSDDAAQAVAGHGPSVATRLIQLTEDQNIGFFHAADGRAFADVQVAGHRETWPVKSSGFRAWLRREFYVAEGSAPSGQAIADAIGTLEGKALYAGPCCPVSVRLAGLGGTIYLDLADLLWRAVEIDANGWRIVAEPPVHFVRPSGMLPLPVPVPGGSLDDLRGFLNIQQEADYLLVLAWLLAALRPCGPYPVLALTGEQGSAKSTALRVLRALVDPNAAAIRAEPKEPRDLMIAARHGWMIALDNLSGLQVWTSDAICRLATGGGFATRTLYSDDEETIFESQRPVAANGIEAFTTRGDLLDRALLVTLDPIPAGKRRTERDFWADFDAAAPRVLGALLSAVGRALATADQIQLSRLPRMADFAVWSYAALGDRGPAFLAAYEGNREDAHTLALAADPIVEPLWTVARQEWTSGSDWIGTASELLAALAAKVGDVVTRRRDWPANGKRLSDRLRRLAPSLRATGLTVTFGREGRRRWIALERTPDGGDDPTPPDDVEDRKAASPTSLASRPEGTSRSRNDVESAGGSDQAGSEAVAGDAASDAAAGVRWAASSATHLNQDRSDSEIHGGPKEGDGGDAGDAALGPSVTCSPRACPGGKVIVIDDAAGLQEVLSRLAQDEVVGLDTETTGLDPRTHQLRLLQLAAPDCVYVVDVDRVDPHLLAPLFAATTGPVFIGHNLKFDFQFLAAAGLVAPAGARLFDTMLATQLLDGGVNLNEKDSFTLATVTKRALGRSLDKTLQGSDWSGTLSEEQIRYAATDAAVLLPLHAALAWGLEEAGLEPAMGLEMSALPAVAWLEQTGAPFDQGQWRSLSDAAVAAQLELEDQLTALAGGTPGFEGRSFNPRSVDQVRRLLGARGHSVDHTAEATLQALRVADPVVDLLLAYREAAKRAGSYGIEFLRHVHGRTGRIHAAYRQIGAATGRMACNTPNLQQVPRDPAYRACFRPNAGRVLVKGDYSQIELRLAAQISGDRNMRAAYQRGEDLHSLTAAAITGKALDAVSKEDRQLAKAANFGLLYGMGAARLRDYARDGYGVTLSEGEANRVRDAFFAAYPGLRAWHRSQSDGVIETRTLAGRRRIGISSFTEKLNSPVQGSGADLLKLALARLWEYRDEVPGTAPVLCVHDEIVLECEAADAPDVAAWLKQQMEAAGAGLLPDVPVVAEVTIAEDWSGSQKG